MTSPSYRLLVFRSSRHTWAQVSDPDRRVLITRSDLSGRSKKPKVDRAFQVGLAIAQELKKRSLTNLVFDRRRYRFHGRVKAVVEGVRKGGIKL